jgi:ergothioneine biosynthesis protein EgtB
LYGRRLKDEALVPNREGHHFAKGMSGLLPEMTANGVWPPMKRFLAEAADQSASLRTLYSTVRAETERRADPLSPEDQQVQSMPDCSPAKWHRAHTSWFFETFVLAGKSGYGPFDPSYGYLFNSYYEAVGPRHPRPQRGLLSRPSVDEVVRYRAHVDNEMERLLAHEVTPETAFLVELGLQHEQQHQELLLTDIKHAFWSNPLHPAYRPAAASRPAGVFAEGWSPEGWPPEGWPPEGWVEIPTGIHEIGEGGSGFAFDNERPRHRIYLQACRVASRPITCGEYLRFIEAGGYSRPEFWLSDGWACVQADGWRAPLYWIEDAEGWRVFTLQGEQPLGEAEPVQHVSFYEAAAYATWAGRRLPTEFEWELAVGRLGPPPAASGRLHPSPIESPVSVGAVWDWTASAYSPYPGFRPARGAVGEYNGKFMCNQMVLRGSSWATPEGHARPTYRNFFPPSARWQASGFRLAEDS